MAIGPKTKDVGRRCRRFFHPLTTGILSGQAMNVAPAREATVEVDRVFDGTTLQLINPLVHIYLAAPWDRVHRRRLLTGNAARAVEISPVDLIKYPSGTLVDGDRSYLVLAGNCFVQEQIAPGITDLELNALWMITQAPNAIEIDTPCLLVARYGEITWGHWVAEMLVKATIAERAYPGRFRYVLPACITETTIDRSYSTAVLESLAAYGISRERLIRLRPAAVYRFADLFDLSGVSNEEMHPLAFQSLHYVTAPVPVGPRKDKITTIRRRPESRAIFNSAAIEALLERRGFTSLTLASMTYLEQVAAFRNSETLVGSMGSNLTGLIFAQPGIGVVTLGPAAWQDGYFTRILQDRQAFHADIRGPSTQMETMDISKSSHIVDPRRLADALAAVSGRPRAGEVVVDGEIMPRTLGRAVLEIVFGSGGNADRFTASGWSAPEASHQWSVGPYCTIEIPPGALPPGKVWLAIKGIGHVLEPYMPVRPLGISLNGLPIGTFDVSGRVLLHCKLSLDRADLASQVVLSFDHRLHPSPCTIGTGGDGRHLGFGFEALTFHSG